MQNSDFTSSNRSCQMNPRIRKFKKMIDSRSLLGVIGIMLALPCAGFTIEARSLPMVAVVPLEGRKVDSLDARTLTDALADQLVKTKAVRVMERSQMDAILKEQGFQQSGACDGQECAVQIGKLLGIDRIVVGSVASFGKAYTIAVREVDVQTGEVLVTASKNLKGEFENLLTDIVPQIARDLANPDLTKTAAISPESSSTPAVPVEQKPTPKADRRSGTWGWWVAGGLAAAGGATAAILLLNDNGSKSNNSTNTDITVRWAK